MDRRKLVSCAPVPRRPPTDDARSIATEIGQHVASLRKQAKLSQAKLGEGADLGPEAISRLERGTVVPSIAGLAKIADALGVTVRDLLPAAPTAGALTDLVALLARRSPDEIEMVTRVAKEILGHVDHAREQQVSKGRKGTRRRR